jgi:hypothetical protein
MGYNVEYQGDCDVGIYWEKIYKEDFVKVVPPPFVKVGLFSPMN